MIKQRPGAHIWKAWADGKTVQLNMDTIGDDGVMWEDEDPRDWIKIGPDDTPERWRIKPPVKSLSVRFAMCKLDCVGNIFFDSATNETIAKHIEEQSTFIKWVTDWIDVEVEVEEDEW